MTTQDARAGGSEDEHRDAREHEPAAATEQAARRRLDPAARRDAILAAATSAFTCAAYPDVSVAAVARLAGVSEGLVFRYFPSKPDLYTAVVRGRLAALAGDQDDAEAALPAGASRRERVRARVEVLLDHVSAHREGWAAPHAVGPADPASTLELRRAARRDQVAGLARVLGTPTWARHEYALQGYLGYLDAACLAWVERGCRPDERWAVVDGALGALEGALGDWGG